MEEVGYHLIPPVDADHRSMRDDKMRDRVGTRLRAARLMIGLSSKQVANSAGCSPSLLSKIENAKVLPSVPMLLRLCDELRVDVGRVMDDQVDVLPTIHRTGTSPKASRFEMAGQGQVHRPGQCDADSVNIKSHYFEIGEPIIGLAHLQGEAIIVVTSGVLAIRCGAASVDARAGDGFHLTTSGMHTFRNGSDADLALVMISRPRA